MYIYKTTNLTNGKIYIGESEVDDPYYFGSGKLILRAIEKQKRICKWGTWRSKFKKEILEECYSIEELNKQEQYWIKYYGLPNLEIGYNLAEGGVGISGYNKYNIKKEWLIKMSKLYSRKEIAKLKGASISTINFYFKRYNIIHPSNRKPNKKYSKLNISTEQLKELYINKKMTQKKIAEMLNVPRATLCLRLKKDNLYKWKTRR